MDAAQGLRSRYLIYTVMFITETEIEALFELYFREFHILCDEYLVEADWVIEGIKNIMFSKRVRSHKLMKFDEEKSDSAKYV